MKKFLCILVSILLLIAATDSYCYNFKGNQDELLADIIGKNLQIEKIQNNRTNKIKTIEQIIQELTKIKLPSFVISYNIDKDNNINTEIFGSRQKNYLKQEEQISYDNQILIIKNQKNIASRGKFDRKPDLSCINLSRMDDLFKNCMGRKILALEFRLNNKRQSKIVIKKNQIIYKSVF